MDPTYPAFPIFAFIAFVLVLIPLPWHLTAWNSGTCLFMIWTAISCLIQFINSIIWRDNILDRAVLWCDISTRLQVAIGVAIPAASLCINRRLYKIATCQSVSLGHTEKRRAVVIDLAIGLGIPFLQMPLQFIVQGHRYDIFEQIGCYPTTVNTPAAYPLSFLWPNIISLISAVYCILTLRAFMIRRAQFAQFLSRNASLTVNRYFRLMALATVEIFFAIPVSSYGLYLNISSKPIYPWTSWSDIHFDWYIVDKFPAALWRSSSIVSTTFEFTRWSTIATALIFFAFFGFADEARKSYRAAFWAVAKRFGFKPTPPAKKPAMRLKGFALGSKDTSSTLPVYAPQKPSTSPTKSASIHSSASRSSLASSDVTETVYGSPTSTGNTNHWVHLPESPYSNRSSRFTL
ncbi:pheromone A receptor-domain-containing protein [Panaeolus papilionaceus]|nr:pheromone A receptor-domain-containing protein [Panaeolus papilionaceus]